MDSDTLILPSILGPSYLQLLSGEVNARDKVTRMSGERTPMVCGAIGVMMDPLVGAIPICCRYMRNTLDLEEHFPKKYQEEDWDATDDSEN